MIAMVLARYSPRQSGTGTVPVERDHPALPIRTIALPEAIACDGWRLADRTTAIADAVASRTPAPA
jgi:hypothetical protein